MNKNKKGFTLIELMTTIGIIAFLAILITIFLRLQVFKGYDARRKTEIKRIGIAAEEYEKDNNCYPIASQVVCTSGGSGLLPYLDRIPCDPVTKASYYYEHEESSCPKWYRLYSNLQNVSDTDYTANIGPEDSFSYVYSSPNAPNEETAEEEGGGEPLIDFYGCFSGSCVQIDWDPSRPGPACDPNFQNSSCYGQCGNPSNECASWN